MSLVTYIARSLHRTLCTLVVAAVLGTACPAGAQTAAVPSITLAPAPAISLTGGVDSNSPAVWDLVDGVETLQVVTSTAGQPSLASGRRLARLGPAAPVEFITHPGHGVWMESVVVDDGGTWYGYYHNEVPATLCDRPTLTLPRIGAARSRDRGETWEDLGIILEAPPGWHDCATPNQYFVGGVGDVSAVLDRDSKDLYLYFSQYSRYAPAQGVAIARLAWADRDGPAGKVMVFNDGAWLPPTRVTSEDDAGNPQTTWIYSFGTPLVPVTQPWHDDDPRDDAFWGASVHWNVSLQLYVMLLNRTKDEGFTQEGIYASFASRLHDPAAWTTPIKIVDGGSWYPQVMGIETGEGSDKRAGARARLFMGGRSTQFIEFNAR
ncbi:MAG TPA: sialidase family protein [Vicinamibacterales bacterium]|nr:sialidase family protein [Vicinamibacterales bacterium]